MTYVVGLDHMAGTDTPPTETGRFIFESGGFRYAVRGPLLAHEDYDTPPTCIIQGSPASSGSPSVEEFPMW